MKHIGKICLSLAIIVCCLIGIAVNAQAATTASGTCGDNLTWKLDSAGTLTISGTGDMEDFDNFDNKAPWSAHSASIKKVIIKSGVTGIGMNAFFSYENLTSVSISGSVVRIGYYAFAGCMELTSVDIAQGVKVIEEGAFQACDNLTDVSIPDSIASLASNAFEYGRSNLQYNTYDNAKYLGNESNPYVVLVSSVSKDIVSCTIHTSTKIIDRSAFQNCSKLKSITIPESVINIGSGAFSGCDNLQYTVYGKANYLGSANNAYYALISVTDKSITATNIHKNTKIIASGAYENCNNLTAATIPNGVVSIGGFAFSSTTALSAITIPESVTLIHEYAFTGSAMEKITFTGDAPTIGMRIFYRIVPAVYYPANNDTWTKAVLKDYGGTITWVGYNELLSIKTQPKTVYAANGSKASTTVKATGDGLTYQWYVKSASASSYTKSSLKTATYSCTINSTTDGRYVRCKITDKYGNSVWTNTVRMRMRDLAIATQPANKTVKDGTTAKFTVKANNSNVTYQWQYRTSSSGSWKNASATGNKTKTLSVAATVAKHGYQYRCRVTDSAGNAVYSKIVSLYVLGIKTQPANKTVKAGATAKFTVAATGKGLTYQWQYRTSSSGSWKNVSTASGKTANYSLTTAVKHHGYQYRCKITDAAGNKVYTKTVTLYVLGIKTQPASKTVKVGATAKFTVAATGKGLTYQWQYRTSSSGSWKNVSVASGKTANYSLTAAARHNGYQYRCKITDSAGNVIYTSIVKLTVK